MPIFRYKAVAADGQILYGEIDAPSKSVAIERLQTSGLTRNKKPLFAKKILWRESSRSIVLHTKN